MLAAAEAADASEDETFGNSDELPDWTVDKQKRLAKIQRIRPRAAVLRVFPICS
ncbi:hypothetical protein [Bradyrhizobium sp. 2S1]|uniref:hypothetical protein n=1 Tax=Bradyrhizobium sp. 2S1 TaxID=1404429 RepID=UPI00140A8C5D|nr:hypothetical protein [Bradyrhizobium sp. 2S1]MCK7672763.1 hypothetical protein [Bradyrhizobium sp. 2S1]